MKYEAWKGSFTDHYFGHLEKGTWIKVSYLKYLVLKIKGYTVRKHGKVR